MKQEVSFYSLKLTAANCHGVSSGSFAAAAAQFIVSPAMDNIDHPVLGMLTYDEHLNWYKAGVTSDRGQGDLFISLDDCDDLDQLLGLASTLRMRLPHIVESARVFSAAELLDLKNGEWADDGGAITPDQFTSRLKLESCVIYPDGSSEITFNDGGLFSGHVIGVSIDELGQCCEATIAG